LRIDEDNFDPGDETIFDNILFEENDDLEQVIVTIVVVVASTTVVGVVSNSGEDELDMGEEPAMISVPKSLLDDVEASADEEVIV